VERCLACEATLDKTTPIRVSLQLGPIASRDVGFIRGSFVLSSCPFAVGIRVHSRSVFASSRLCVRFWLLSMRYLVKARVKPGQESALARAIDDKTLGRGSVAGDEYLWDMEHARITADHAVTWVEVCFCATPLAEERPYWEEYFELISIKDAHARKNCRDLNGDEPWACTDCDCTQKLEEWLSNQGNPFLAQLDRE
jgi:hypothetical protein